MILKYFTTDNSIVSNEEIAFQSKNFYIELSNQIENIIRLMKEDLSLKDIKKCIYIKNLSDVIKKYTNMSVSVNINNSEIVCAFLPILTNNHVFQNYYKEQYGSIFEEIFDEKEYVNVAKELKNKKSLIDLKTGKVNNGFSNVECLLDIDFNFIYGAIKDTNITENEYKFVITEIILHEIGHLFTSFLMLDRNTTTNNVLSLISKIKKSDFDYNKKEYIIKDILEIDSYKEDKEQINNLINCKNDKELAIVFLNLEMQKSISQLGSNIYDLVGCEQMADNYAVRYGSGKYLAIFLEKMHKNENWKLYNKKRFILFIGGLITLLFITFPFLIATLYIIISFLNYLFLNFTISLTLTGNEQYDDIETRINRLIQTNVERLKDKDTDDETKKIILEENKTMRSIVNNLTIDKPLYVTLKEYFSSDFRDKMAFIKLQKNLEKIASNKLFEKAYELTTLK